MIDGWEHLEEAAASLSSADESMRTRARPVAMAYSEDDERFEPLPPKIITGASALSAIALRSRKINGSVSAATTGAGVRVYCLSLGLAFTPSLVDPPWLVRFNVF